ncbi:FtsK/SpoIIIE domain-containing protein [Kineococcus gynurae]|uniref:FtsK/SpoIIIE domain-containing protein n=1 Tax=Kineococcus gynurae TaxID=452979 RepID=A0ABV5LX70_9ACTN
MQLRWEVDGIAVVVEAAPGTGFDAVREAVAAVADRPAVTAWWVGGAQLGAGHVLGRPPLLQGARLSSRPGGPRPRERDGIAVMVDGGPDAGACRFLAPGPHVIGRRAAGGVRIDDPALSREHLLLSVGSDGTVTAEDLGSTNGTRRWGAGGLASGPGPSAPIGPGPVPLPRASTLLPGDSLIRVAPDPVPGAAVRADGEGHLLLNPYPRLPGSTVATVLTWPELPAARSPHRLPVAALLVPLGTAVVLALVWSPLSLLLGLATPLLVGLQWVGERRHARSTSGRERAGVEQERDRLRRLHGRALAEETVRRHDAWPGPATLLAEVAAPGTRVFARAPGDEDHLHLRVGLGELPAACRLERRAGTVGGPEGPDAGSDDRTPDAGRPGSPPPSRLLDVPVTVDLEALGILGVAGGRERVVASARFLIAQLLAWHRPGAVRVQVLAADTERARSWRWTEDLPHVPTPVLVGDAAVGALRRLAAPPPRDGRGDGRDRPPGPVTVLLVDGTDDLRRRGPLAQVLSGGGVLAVCLDSTRARLAAECRGVLDLSADGRGRLVLPGTEHVVRVDGVDAAWAREVAGGLAPLREAGPGPADTPPTGRRLPELLGLPATGSGRRRAVAARWDAPAPGGLATPLGTVAGGGVWVLDLVQDGPHVLVAGTTGAGKSVLLRSLVLGLALGHPPERLQFVLVDFKGGAAFAAAADLPHVAGLVTDLDDRTAARVLRSLGAEVRRRERELAVLGAPDVAAVPAGHPVAARLPRLVVVVDEFRVLGEELPEFVPGLVRLAAVGRSLGIHLVLATQRPAGAVSPEIRANVDLRIALRVADRADSEDVLADPRAASIDPATPGRGLARTSDGRLSEVQVAATSGPVLADPTGPRVRRRDQAPPPTTAVDDVTEIVTVLADVTRRRDRPLPSPPWLPPLPFPVDPADPAPTGPDLLPWGMLDEPDAQRRSVAGWDLGSAGHLLVVGTTRSGRSTLLRTLARAGARLAAEVVVLDGGGTAADLAATDPATVVVGGHEPWRAARALDRVLTELLRRRRDPTAPRARILLLVDGWEGWHRSLSEADTGAGPGAALDVLLRVLREGAGVGIHVALAGDRGLLTAAPAALATEVVLLRLADRADAVLAGVKVADVPRAAPPGRGLLVRDGAAREVQVALPGGPGGAATTSPAGTGPARRPAVLVRALPPEVGRGTLPPAEGYRVAVGRGGDAADVVRLDTSGPVLVAGPAGSGRSTLLATIAAGVPDAVRVGPGSAAEVSTALARAAPPLLLLDDLATVAGTVVEDLLLQGLRRPGGLRLVASGGTAEIAAEYRGVAAALRSTRTTVLLGRGDDVPAELMGRRSLLAPGPGPGAGFVVVDGSWTSLRVAR